MPDTEEVKKNEKTVDLDTSGPAMDVDILNKKMKLLSKKKKLLKLSQLFEK